MKGNQEMLEHGSFRSLLVRLSVPSVVIMLVMVVYNSGQNRGAFTLRADLYGSVRSQYAAWQRRLHRHIDCSWQ